MTSASNENQYHPCFLIPCYNHGSTIAAVVESLSVFSLPVLVVDDGSNEETKRALDALANEEKITLIRLSENQGKGGAVMAGIKQALLQGFSHAIQIDADGQHDLEAVPTLLQASQANPNRLISGQPRFTTKAYLNHVSTDDTRPMFGCGLRRYRFLSKTACVAFELTLLPRLWTYSTSTTLVSAWTSTLRS
ncbi:glycosyltransferase family 2 protein [Vibrio harveyi]|nr:glycosyltransferase family 2 protein [Vibrio harveyi]